MDETSAPRSSTAGPAQSAAAAAWALATSTIRSARDDRIGGVAAQVAFFALLAIPSILLLLAGAAGYAGRLLGTDTSVTLQRQITQALGSFLSPDVMDSFVRPVVDDLFNGGRADLLSAGALIGLWSMSRAVKVLIEAMNVAYDIDDWRAAWKRRLLAIGIAVGGLLTLVLVVPLMLAGPNVGTSLVQRFSLPSFVGSVWRVAYWPCAAGVVIAMLATLYHAAPNWRTPWRRDVPGAVLAALAWVAAAGGLRIYVARAISTTTAGPLAAPMILLLWLYVSAFAVLMGAELNAEIEKRWEAKTGRAGVSRRVRARLSAMRERRRAGNSDEGGDASDAFSADQTESGGTTGRT